MLRIAVCDDDPAIRRQLGLALDVFSSSSGITVERDEYPDGSSLLSASAEDYDLLILDVQMGEPNGIETARRLRKAGCRSVIVFYTNYVQYALEGYEVQAYRFLLKPLTEAQFAEVVGKALLELQAGREDVLPVRVRDGVLRVRIAEIRYAETERGHVAFCMKGGERVLSSAPMKEVEAALSGRSFFRCHSAYLVNLRVVHAVEGQDVVLEDGARLPLSKHRRRALKEALTLLWGDQFL
ncbi:MAG: LytTR family DNA-binding domain-containing protein [Clostridiales bacterium]|nr:LytTR family DNA-binding domain-containing protein [Clostridiales bacterium]